MLSIDKVRSTSGPKFRTPTFQAIIKKEFNLKCTTSSAPLPPQVKYIWTSGRQCDFRGCERPDLQPTNVNGWFWTAELQKLAPTTDRQQNDWSENGGIGQPQPDNREVQQGGAKETCLAVLNNFYNDGVHWHDVACHHRKPWVCEENDALLKYVRYTNPNLRI